MFDSLEIDPKWKWFITKCPPKGHICRELESETGKGSKPTACHQANSWREMWLIPKEKSGDIPQNCPDRERSKEWGPGGLKSYSKYPCSFHWLKTLNWFKPALGSWKFPGWLMWLDFYLVKFLSNIIPLSPRFIPGEFLVERILLISKCTLSAKQKASSLWQIIQELKTIFKLLQVSIRSGFQEFSGTLFCISCCEKAMFHSQNGMMGVDIRPQKAGRRLYHPGGYRLTDLCSNLTRTHLANL